jgi:hypothetical protein
MRLLLKRIAALLLAVSFVLPLTQCSQKVGDTGASVTVSASTAYDWPGALSTITLLLFFWPLAVQIWRFVAKVRAPSRRAAWIEFGLSLASLAGISCLVFLSSLLWFGATIRYGAFIAYLSALVYGAVSFIEAIRGSPRRE